MPPPPHALSLSCQSRSYMFISQPVTVCVICSSKQSPPPPPPFTTPTTRYLTPTPNEPQALLLDLDRVKWDFEVSFKWLLPPPHPLYSLKFYPSDCPPPLHLSAHHHGLVPNYWKLCESRGGRPGLTVLTSLLVSVDIKLYWTMLRHWSQLVPNMSTDIRGHWSQLDPNMSTDIRGHWSQLDPNMSTDIRGHWSQLDPNMSTDIRGH